MSKTASTATKEAKKQASSTADFKKRKKGSPLPLPSSGLTVLARRVQLRQFLEQGDVPNPLLEVVQEALDKGAKMKPEKMMGDGDSVDLEMVREMFITVNAVIIRSVVDPPVHPMVWTEQDLEDELIDDEELVGETIPDSWQEEHDDILYVDDFDDEDKMFIFQWAIGGTGDLATFREESKESMAALARKQKPGKKSKRPAGSKKG